MDKIIMQQLNYQLKLMVKKKKRKVTDKINVKNTYFALHPGLNVSQDF